MSFKRIGKLRDIVDVPPKDWRDIGENLCESIREHVRHQTYFSIVPYSPEYASAKSAGDIQHGASKYRGGGVNLSLTGKMLDGLAVRQAKDGVVIGWLGAEAAKVAGNARKGRAITTSEQPLIPPVKSELLKDLTALFGRRNARCYSTTKIQIAL